MNPQSLVLPPGQVRPGAFGHNRGVVRHNYAIMPPEGVMDSYLPTYEKTVVRFLAAPALGAGFAQAVLEMAPDGGTLRPLADAVQRLFYVLEGTVILTLDGKAPATLGPEAYGYIPPDTRFALRTAGDAPARVLGLKKPYRRAEGFDPPQPIVSHRSALEKVNHNGTEGRTWEHLLPHGDFRFDMEMNILSFAPGTHFPDVETHIMEHGLYMLEGQGMILLGSDWHETWAGDFIWMGPFCPQLFYPTGWSRSAYLLYKDVNRDVVF